MGTIGRGLREELITEALQEELQRLGLEAAAVRLQLRPAEAADRIALHLARIVQGAVQDLKEEERVELGVRLSRALVARIDEFVRDAQLLREAPIEPGEVLRAVRGTLPDGSPEELQEPLIPLLDTALLTNAPGEPRVGNQLLTEIHSADRIDVVMAFIRRTGVAPLLAALARHTSAGRELRVLTTTYTGSTEARALEALAELGAKIRVSYDTSTTRLHAKAWLFHRNSGFSTAYIGSSNLTHSALVSGLESNVRVSGARNPAVIGKVATVFESYWNSRDFEDYERAKFEARSRPEAHGTGRTQLSPIELRPEPFQERLLELIELAREQGRHRNLLVSATGTGKTVMAAIDYVRLRTRLPRARLLFVAHREELLEQSRATFRHALREEDFGELWVGGQRPHHFEHVFASIQSLDSAGYAHLPRDHFDVVIVDEFHHAAAPSYRALLDHVLPRELLGLTATPERSDRLTLLDRFDGRIAAELRLWDAIDQHRLAPFLYYGVSDGLDLRDIPWRRGHGYDVTELSNLLTSNDAWAHLVLHQLEKHVDDLSKMRALGFCVSVEHARFMARIFRKFGVASTAVWGDSPDEERRAALGDLQARRVNVVFSVDLFNEGIDVPDVDTLLFLRPTDSPTLFLQQLGRGLRKSHGKTVCTVLDFVGQHRKDFRFERRFRALLGGSRRDLIEQVQGGFPFLPAGCHLELDAVAKEHVLANLRDALPTRWSAKAEQLRQLAGSSPGVGLATFLTETGLELDDVYTGNHCWSDLRAAAGLDVLPAGPHEAPLRRACGRLLHVDDRERLDVWREWLTSPIPSPRDRSPRRLRLLRMLVASVADQVLDRDTSLDDALTLLHAHPQVRAELVELLDCLASRIEHVHPVSAVRPDLPLAVHARYTRIEILAALGAGEPAAHVPPWQSGVYWASSAMADLLAFTLDKTSGQFSPSTSYKDRALSPELIQWESQSITRASSETGLRYQQHAARGSSILLFARLRADERAFWYLGPATYVRHESERPMSITWRLEHPLPGDLYATFAAAVA